jgi:hypothetical protein
MTQNIVPDSPQNYLTNELMSWKSDAMECSSVRNLTTGSFPYNSSRHVMSNSFLNLLHCNLKVKAARSAEILATTIQIFSAVKSVISHIEYASLILFLNGIIYYSPRVNCV